MPRRSKALLNRADRVTRAEAPPVIMMYNNPEAVRLGFDLKSEREVLIKDEVFEAGPSEGTRAFHVRMCQVARERGVYFVSVGSDEPVKKSLFALDGSPLH
jgi:hypothetical protein